MSDEILDKFPELLDDHATSSISFVHKGWSTIISKMLDELNSVCMKESTAELKIGQIKEKFGQLRVYYRKSGFSSEGDELVQKIVNEAMAAANVTCDICGAQGVLGHENGVVAVRCRKHKKFKW